MRPPERRVLARLLAVPDRSVAPGPGETLVVGAWRFRVVPRPASGPAPRPAVGRGTLPVFVAPYVGPRTAERLRAAGVSWFDLSGNADLTGPGLRIHIEGRPNQFAARGRPSSPFAPRSSRVARTLLMNRGRAFSQRELAQAAHLDEGRVSRVVHRLEEIGALRRLDDRRVESASWAGLFDLWDDAYDFGAHEIVRGHFPGGSGPELARSVAAILGAAGLPHALTGLSAAWEYTAFAGYRLVSLYLASEGGEADLAEHGFVEDPRGASLWIIRPKDSSELEGAREVNGLRCVHPLQACLDLRGHPERAAEARGELRERLIRGSLDEAGSS